MSNIDSNSTNKKSMLLKFKQISMKLPLVIIAAAAISALSAGGLGYYEINVLVDEAVDERVETILNGQKRSIGNYFHEVEKDIHYKLISYETQHALEDFTHAWQAMGETAQETLQKAYITDNPNKLGEKEKLHQGTNNTTYDIVHGKHHEIFTEFVKTRGYYDLFLFDLKGNIIYSVYKEPDFATNFLTGEFKDSGLGTTYREALKLGEDKFIMHDFEKYKPSAGAPASFIAGSVFDKSGKKIGVIAMQMPLDIISEIMSNSGRLGDTGETFIVGTDGTFRTHSILHPDSKILESKVEAAVIKQSTVAETHTSHDAVYFGHEVIMSATNFEFHGVTWTLVAVQDLDEIYSVLIEARNFMIMVVLGVLIVVGLIGWLLSRSITNPILNLTNTMSAIANKKLDTIVEGSKRVDEIGDMARAVVVFKENALANVQFKKDKIAAQKAAAVKAQQEREDLADSFQNNIMSFIENVGTSCDKMSGSSLALKETASQSKEISHEAQTSSERAAMNVQTVASAAEELSSSITEIGRQVNQSREIVGNVMTNAEETNEIVSELAKAAKEIEHVILLIQDIAEQTNLLALNATIEAASAGDAGRGFAVVASEVKNLASQTSKATDEISSHIGLIQTSTDHTVDAIKKIISTMNQVNEVTTVIATAVKEQGAATGLISQNIQEAATETNHLSESIATVSVSAQEVDVSAQEMYEATGDLNDETKQLHVEVDQFISQIRVA